ncbi:MAG: MFS transporter [Acidimicrobiales bacterium]
MNGRARRGDDPGAEGVVFDRVPFAGVTVALGLIGGTNAAYGTLLVGIARHFGLALASAGLTLSVSFAGALVGVALCWFVLGRSAGGPVLAAALVVFSVGMSVAALAPTWPAFLGGVALSGVGFGAIDFGVLNLTSRTAHEGRAARLSVSGSGWAFGAIAGPLLVVAVRPQHFAVFFGIASAVGLVLVPFVLGVNAPPVHAEVRQAMDERRPGNRRVVLWTFLSAFGSYVAVEAAVSGWLAAQLHGWGYPAAVGSLVTAGFWAGLAIGRLVSTPMLRLLAGHQLVLVGLGLAITFLMGSGVRWLAPVAYPLVGLTLALVFPLGFHWFTELIPDDHNAVAWLVFAGMVGGILGPGSESLAVAHFGLHVVSYVAAGLTFACMAVFAVALRFPIPVPAPRAAPPT